MLLLILEVLLIGSVWHDTQRMILHLLKVSTKLYSIKPGMLKCNRDQLWHQVNTSVSGPGHVARWSHIPCLSINFSGLSPDQQLHPLTSSFTTSWQVNGTQTGGLQHPSSYKGSPFPLKGQGESSDTIPRIMPLRGNSESVPGPCALYTKQKICTALLQQRAPAYCTSHQCRPSLGLGS